MPEPQVQIPPGLIVITTYGVITQQTVSSLLEARSFAERQGLKNVSYQMISGTLVEKARNEAVRQTLRNTDFQWLLQCDADMTWQPDAFIRILASAYGELPAADVMGAYCPLRGDLALPTMDTGTGTWEAGWFPGSGIVRVIRTGAAFLLVKRHVLEALKDPWFRMRVPARPMDFMAEVDNFARLKFDGRNPFREMPNREWERLEDCAKQDPSVVAEQFVPVEVGEDSGFCDRVCNAGFSIYVNTDIVCGHVEQTVTSWPQHKKALETNEVSQRQCCGILT